jgi:hypothetical protein
MRTETIKCPDCEGRGLSGEWHHSVVGYLIRWCREKGVSPANAAMWELAEKQWIEANCPNGPSSAATPGERSTDVR